MHITPELTRLIRRFWDVWDTDPLIQQLRAGHQRRIEAAAALFQPERIPQLTRDEIAAFLQDTDAWFGLRWNKQEYWERVFGIADANLPQLRAALADLVQHAEIGLTAENYNALLSVLPGIGPAYLSEILALRFPDRYWTWNKQVRNFLGMQQVNVKAELPRGKKGDQGEQYLVIGHHLTDLRRALGDAVGRPMDYMLTDSFIYWVNQAEQPADPWAEQIARWLEELPAERLKARQAGETRARALLEAKLGQFTAADVRQFLTDLSADWDGQLRQDRFMPAFYGASANQIVETLPAFNRWTQRLWQATDAELDALLDEFWAAQEVAGAGTSLPTAALYLRDPLAYNIWLPVMSEGLEQVSDFLPGRWRTAEGYRRYNAALNAFRAQYQLPPQCLDVILWKIARVRKWNAVQDRDDSVTYGTAFTGFTPDVFTFLQELATNNSEEWMHRHDNANELRYQRVLREPLRELFKAVAPTVKELDPTFETEAKFGKVLAVIRKRFPDEEGPYHTHYWGAFYRQGRTKQTDAQLFVIVHPTHVNVGLSVAGAQGSEVVERFRRNLRQAPEVFLALLKTLPLGCSINTAARHGMQEKSRLKVETLADVAQLLEPQLIDIERLYPADDPCLQRPDFAQEVVTLFQALYPLYRFVVTDDPAELAALLPPEMSEDETVEPEPRLTLAGVSAATYLDPEFLRQVEFLFQDKKQIIFYGPPGTGKTFVARWLARYWVDIAPEPGGEVQVVQFHPSYAYEEFVEGIRPQSERTADGHHEISYPVKKGLFRRFCDEARQHPQQHYVLILDEINRGELPRIFGELLYLLEYRTEIVTLPYSGERFAIPANLYLIGTLNTADRSIALVDHALRRRFHFVALKPEPEIVRAYFEHRGQTDRLWLADLLELVNTKLQQDGIEWHLHIGHSHFLRPNLDDTQLRLIWEHSIRPTLEEYFYRQPNVLQAYTLETLRAELGLT